MAECSAPLVCNPSWHAFNLHNGSHCILLCTLPSHCKSYHAGFTTLLLDRATAIRHLINSHDDANRVKNGQCRPLHGPPSHTIGEHRGFHVPSCLQRKTPRLANIRRDWVQECFPQVSPQHRTCAQRPNLPSRSWWENRCGWSYRCRQEHYLPVLESHSGDYWRPNNNWRCRH